MKRDLTAREDHPHQLQQDYLRALYDYLKTLVKGAFLTLVLLVASLWQIWLHQEIALYCIPYLIILGSMLVGLLKKIAHVRKEMGSVKKG